MRFWAALFVLTPMLAADWPVYRGDAGGASYSPLKLIDRTNVARLAPAWTFDTGDAFGGSEMQCNPLVIDGIVYATTPKLKVIALEGTTGRLLWTFDPHQGQPYARKSRNRGLMHWTDGQRSRLYFAVDEWFYALDRHTGKLASEFGDHGRINLKNAFDRDPGILNISLTTPGAVYKDLLVLGSITSEDHPAAPGDIRAYDARTGKLRWSFHTIPHPGEPGYETWPPGYWKFGGGANNWTGMALDEKRGIVFVPTGSATFDFYGADRHGDDLYANCLLALDANTGKRIWHFQFVRHDLWDRDLPAPPTLVEIRRGGRTIDAVAQITKSGYVFVFDRETGKPLYPIEWRTVAQTDVEGEQTAAKQPLPLKPPPFARQVLTEDLLTNRTPEAHRAVLERFRKVRSGPQFTPPSLQGTVIFPGFDGGGEWGGAAFDRSSGLLYVNSNEMAWILRLRERERAAGRETARTLYDSQCASCHRKDMRGTPPEFPSLVDLGSRRSAAAVEAVIRKGGGRMPAFGKLPDNAVRALVDLLMTGEAKEVVMPARAGTSQLRYTMDGYNKFLDPDGFPAVKPPWGTLNAIDLNKGEIAWSIPFGEIPASGLKNTGSENYGGGVVTAGGLFFIGATDYDRKFHVYDSSNGKLLYEYDLPAGGNATPAVYEAGGRQYVVIAAGGGKSNQPSGGSYVAFTLGGR